MYVLVNVFHGGYLNVGSDMDKAFDCFLAAAIIAGVNLTEPIESYRDTFHETQRCTCDNVYLFNSRLYCVANDELITLS